MSKNMKGTELFVAKKRYSNDVLMDGWYDRTCSLLPIDVNPFKPGEVNQHLSHYKRLGSDDNVPMTTETVEMLKQIEAGAVKSRQRIVLVNLLTCDEYTRCPNETDENVDGAPSCVASTFDAYRTTMQKSYGSSYPLAMRRLAMARTPHLLYRKMRSKPKESEKFMDDNFARHTGDLIRAKRRQHVSYDPGTGLNTDGTLPNGGDRKPNVGCHTLDY